MFHEKCNCLTHPLGFSELCLFSLRNGSTDYTKRNLVNNLDPSTKTLQRFDNRPVQFATKLRVSCMIKFFGIEALIYFSIIKLGAVKKC